MEPEQKSTSEMSMNIQATVIEVAGENEIQISELTEVEKHKNEDCLLKSTYDSIKDKKSPPNWARQGEIVDDKVYAQKSPMGNTVLHIAALYGNDNWVEKITQNASHSHLLAAKNANGDTALHVAAKAGHISTLKKLLAASLDNLSHPYSEKPKDALGEILVKNKQGNTFFHEALLNGHKDVMKILDSPELQIGAGFVELVERAALFWTNKEGKSVLHLAIEKGFGDIVGHALTKLTREYPALDMLIQNHQELAEMIPKPPLPEKDQAREKRQQQDSSSSTDTLKPRPPLGAMADPHTEISEGNEKYQELAQLIPYGPHYVPPGQSPLILAILKMDAEIFCIILKKKKEWIHLRDNKGRTALHYAASIGYIFGVKKLLENCTSCNAERDNDGLFPLHLASAGGHAKVLKILLEHCPDPREILDRYGRNIVHIAAQMGKLNVIRYILQNANHGLVKMINDPDADGNTPLHLAAKRYHPKIVLAMTWDKRVDLSLVNKKNQTALDACMQSQQENPPLEQWLTLTALKAAGVQSAKRRLKSIEVPPPPPPPPQSAESVCQQKPPNMEPYKDRINTLMLVSMLITTVTFAAGFTLPGGTNSSDAEKGMATMLHHVWFKLFIFGITISMYGSISVTIVLIWAQLGYRQLTRFALKVAMPQLGITLATLSVAFLAGVHLVISDLSWLATAFLVLCVISILILSLQYILLCFFCSSRNTIMRYICFYPFRFLAWLVEQDETEGI